MYWICKQREELTSASMCHSTSVLQATGKQHCAGCTETSKIYGSMHEESFYKPGQNRMSKSKIMIYAVNFVVENLRVNMIWPFAKAKWSKLADINATLYLMRKTARRVALLEQLALSLAVQCT